MPQPFHDAVMTNSGAALLTRAQAGECKIQLTRIAIGDGTYTEAEETTEALQARTELKSMRNSYELLSKNIYSDYSVRVTALLTNKDPLTGETLVTEAYYINEMGLYAKEADGSDDTEILYSITTTTGDHGDLMPPYNGYSPAQITQEYYATVNNSLEVLINTVGSAIEQAIDNAIAENTAEWEETINAAVEAEAEAREAAISAEAEAREAAISAEAEAREAADADLQASIEAETKAREAADNNLSGDIAAEATAREQADNSLSTEITAAAKAASDAATAASTAQSAADAAQKTADSATTAISAETTAREAADNSLNAAISAETAAREAADTSLNSDLQNLISVVNVNSAAAHNAIFRGKYLGTSVTDEQWAAIKAGTFDDLYIGDYWTIGGFDWVIADFDYWWNRGDDGNEYTNHHIVIVPPTMLYNTYMNSSGATDTGYISSYMYTTGLADAKTMINSAFGSDHIVNHREYLVDSVTGGYPDGAKWFDSTVELMNTEMVYGCTNSMGTYSYLYLLSTATIDQSQLALFRYDRTEFIVLGNGSNGGTSGTRYDWWLRDTHSSTSFFIVSASGAMSRAGQSNVLGVRPCFGIC